MPVTATNAGNPDFCNDQPNLPGAKNPTSLPVSCQNQHVICSVAPSDSGTGDILLSKIHTVDLKGAEKSTIDHIMRDRAGNAVNIAGCLCLSDSSSSSSSSSNSSSEEACAHSLIFRLKEYLGGTSGCTYAAEVVDAETGQVRVTLSAEDTAYPGVYFGEFAIIETQEEDSTDPPVVVFSNSLYVHIGRNIWNAYTSGTAAKGPPSIAEIRLHLRDKDPKESYLLDNVAFSDSEIAQATYLPVEYWNETQPPIRVTYNTVNFPFRYHWLMGITGYLFLTVAEQQRRNNLQYSASGVQVNDQNKAIDYEQAAERRLTEFKNFVRRKKIEMNIAMGFGSLGSSYGGGYTYR